MHKQTNKKHFSIGREYLNIDPLKLPRWCNSNNLPILDKDTITASLWSGCVDIFSQTDFQNSFLISMLPTQSSVNRVDIEVSQENLKRMFHVLFPPSPELAAR